MEDEIIIPYDDPMIIDYIDMPSCCGRMNLSEKSLARLAAQPTRPSDFKIKLPKRMMDIDTAPAAPGVLKGPGYSTETIADHPNNGMHYVYPPPPPPLSAFPPKKTPEQLKAQAESIEARLAAARAAIEVEAAAAAAAPSREWIDPTTGEEAAATGSNLQVEQVPVLKHRCEDPNPASAASSGVN